MMKDSITVAVIDFGSSAIKAALIERYPDERYIIKHHREAPSEGAIVRGKIHNLNDTAEKVRLLIQQLERDSGLTIKQVYAAVGGQSLRSHLHHMERSFEEPHEVTEEDLSEFQEQLDNFSHDTLEVLAEVSPTYYINGAYVRKPVGVQALNLRVEYQLIMARHQLSENIYLVLQEKLGLEVAGLIMSPIVLADRFLTDEQKRIGCALIDFGAACTTVSVYHKGALATLRVIPLGSHNITTDLTWMHMSTAEAERVKREELNLFNHSAQQESVLQVKAADMVTPRTVSRLEANQYAEARAKEIVDNIKAICTSPKGDMELPGGVVITGGGSALNGLAELLHRVMGVHVERISSLVVQDRANEFYILTPAWHVVYSMGKHATAPCDLTQELSNTTTTNDGETEPEATTPPPLYPEDELDETEFTGNRRPDQSPLFSPEEMEELEQEPEVPIRTIKPVVKQKKTKSKQQGKGLFNLFSKMGEYLLPSDLEKMSSDED